MHLFSEVLRIDDYDFIQKTIAEQNCSNSRNSDCELKVVLICLVKGYASPELIDYVVKHPITASECHIDFFAGKHEQLVPCVSSRIFRIVKR